MSAAGSPKRGDGSRKKASVNTDTPLEGRSIASLVKMVTELSAKNPNSLAGKLNAVDDRATGLPAEAINLLDDQFTVDNHSLGWLEILFIESSRFEHISKQDFASRCNALGAVLPLYTAVVKLRPSPEHLTGVHAELLKVCLKSQCYHIARRILDDDIAYIEDKAGTTAFNVLLYYYYGGLVYAASRNYDRALQFFSTALSLPSDAVSAVMVAAYKKYLLVCLLQHGKFVELPEYARFITRSIKPFVGEYVELGNAYNHSDIAEFASVVEKHRAKLTEDKNIGLVQQCQDKRTRRNIQKLTQTFLTLSLEAIAVRVGLDSVAAAEAILVQMIDAGAIHATIDQSHGTVVFGDDDECFDTEASLARLQDGVAATGRLYDKIKEIDTELRTAPKFVKKVSQSKDDRGDMVVDTFDDTV